MASLTVRRGIAAIATVLLCGALFAAPSSASNEPSVTTSADGTTSYRDPALGRLPSVRVRGTVQTAVIDSLAGKGGEADRIVAIRKVDGTHVPVDLPPEAAINGARIDAQILEQPQPLGPAAAAQAEPSPVASATITQPVVARSGTAVPSAHRVYVAVETGQGSIVETDPQIGAAVDQILDYWLNEADGAISSFQRVDIKRFDSTLDIPVADGCGMSGQSQPFDLWDEAAAQFPGVSFDSPGNHLMVIVAPECAATGTVGVAVIGNGLADGGPLTVALEPSVMLSAGAHEFGHNFGLEHANLRTCPTLPDCAYWDLYSVMGLSVPGYPPPALGSIYRTQLGIDGVADLATARLETGQHGAETSFALSARDGAIGLRGLKVVDPISGRTYWVDWRSGADRDSGSFYGSGPPLVSPYSSYPAGVTIEQQDPPQPQHHHGETFLLTRMVGSQQVGSFGAGNTFTAPGGALRLRVDSIGASANVTVTLGLVGLTVASPTVSGKAKVGQRLTAVPGQWTSGAQFSYRWYANGTPISGATGQSYLIPAAMKGKGLLVRVTGTKTGYVTAARISRSTAPVVAGTLTAPTPKISGKAKVNKTLTAKPGSWTSGTKLTYRWYANGKAISRATKRWYKITKSKKGKRITVKVTGTKTGYYKVVKTSAKTAKVKR